jgi:hypothetical protein
MIHAGFITPIHKPKTDDFRLIYLINTDRKIFTKLLSNHLFKFINFCDLQIGFRPGIWINENILTFHEIFRDNDSFIELIDFTNAFDSVDFQWIDFVLKTSLSPTWHSALMSCIGGIAFLNYDLTSPMILEAGVRQGDCISSLLFNLCIDPLLKRLESKISGVSILNTNIPALAYADDVTVTTKTRSQHDLCWVFIRDFCNVSGLSVNLNKSFSVGRKHSHLKHASTFKYLGITYTNNKLDWHALQHKIKLKYQFYHNFIKRFYTYPRVLLFNTLIASNLVFHLRSFKAPAELIKTYKNLISKCFPRISFSRLIASKDSGGFGLMDIESCNKNWLASWRFYLINRICSYKNSIYLTLCDKLSHLNKPNIYILICWYKFSDNIKLYIKEDRLFHWLEYNCNILFYFGDYNDWPLFWSWERDDEVKGPHRHISETDKRLWDLLPATGKDLIYYIDSFTVRNTGQCLPISKFKLFKQFKPPTYSLTPSQFKKHGDCKSFKKAQMEVIHSKSTLKAKWWALDQLHNANGLAINKEICFICGKIIKSCHFLEKCKPPDTATFPTYFTKIDVAWCLYLSHLHFKYPNFHSTYNLLSDFKLIM